MRNYLIRILGGVTATEFSEVFALAAKDREVMQNQMEFYRGQCNLREDRLQYLENLILTKTGFIVANVPTGTDTSDMKPIGGSSTWGKVKHNLEMTDKRLMQEKLKNARH